MRRELVPANTIGNPVGRHSPPDARIALFRSLLRGRDEMTMAFRGRMGFLWRTETPLRIA